MAGARGSEKIQEEKVGVGGKNFRLGLSPPNQFLDTPLCAEWAEVGMAVAPAVAQHGGNALEGGC